MGFELIWYAALDSKCDLVADRISQKSIRLILRFQCFFNLVNGFSFIAITFWHQMQVSVMFWSSQKDAQRKTMQYGGGVSSRSAVGTRLVTKTMPCIAIGSQGCPYWGPGVSRELFSLIFALFSLISRLFEAIWGWRLEQPGAPCGGLWRRIAHFWVPFKMMQ